MKDKAITRKPLFMPDEDWHNNAKLNFSHDFSLFAEGYKKAADILVANIEENDGQDVDYLVYPIAFLYRHHLELRFKEIIKEGELLLAKSNRFPMHNKLDSLWERAKQIINEVWENEPRAVEEFWHIDHIVSELSMTDPKSDSFRFPVGTDGRNSLAGFNLINVRHLREEIEKTYEFLYCVSAFLEESNDYRE